MLIHQPKESYGLFSSHSVDYRSLWYSVLFLCGPSSTSWISQCNPWTEILLLKSFPECLPTLHPRPKMLQRKCLQVIFGLSSGGRKFVSQSRRLLNCFFFFFFFSFQITQNWFGSMTSTLACMKNKEWRLCLIWNQKRGISTFSVFSIFIKTVFFSF